MLNPRRVLLRVPNWIGDAAMATSVVQAFERQRPEVGLEIAGRGAVTDLFPGLLPAGRCHHLAPGLPQALRGRFDLGVLLPDSFSSAWVFFRAGIPSLGRRGDARSLLLKHPRPPRPRPPRRHVLEEWDELLEPLGVTPSSFVPRVVLDDAERAAGARRLLDAAAGARRLDAATATASRGPGAGLIGCADTNPAPGPDAAVAGSRAPVVVLCPGAAFGSAKRWPVERFAALARELRSAGVACVASGTSGEAEAVRRVAEAAGTAALLGLPVREWASCLAAADLVITNDSGASHVAAACGTPVLALFGSTSPAWTRPMGPGHRLITLGLACSPCFQRECPLGHLDCLLKMTVEQVYQAALETLREAGMRRPITEGA